MIKIVIQGARPKTLIVGIVPPIAAFILIFRENNYAVYPMIWVYLLLCVFGALSIQIATNLFNDAIDFEKGADAKRIGPIRLTASGLMPKNLVKSWAIFFLVLALLFGIPLIMRGGFFIGLLGIISLYLAYGYTGGITSLAYRGLGELFVFLFFGLFSFLGSYYIFGLQLNFTALLYSCIFGLLSTTFISINNLRDRELDASVGKKTLATKMPRKLYIAFTIGTVLIPYGIIFTLQKWNYFSLLFIPALTVAFLLLSTVINKKEEDLNQGLKFAALHMLLFLICI